MVTYCRSLAKVFKSFSFQEAVVDAFLRLEGFPPSFAIITTTTITSYYRHLRLTLFLHYDR